MRSRWPGRPPPRSAPMMLHCSMNGGAGLLSDRTSYVIARDGRITMVHSDSDWREHVSRTLAAVRALDR